MTVLVRDVLILCGTALAAAATLGIPPGPPALLRGRQLAFLAFQGGLASLWCAVRLRPHSRGPAGAAAGVFATLIPLAVLMMLFTEWRDGREPLLGWWHLVGAGVALAAVETVPVTWLVLRVARRTDAGEADPA